MSEDIGKFLTEEHVNFITVPDGDYKGVSYKIKKAEFETRDGKKYLKFDYDVKGLTPGDEIEFEQYLGNFIIESLRWYLEEETRKDGSLV